MNRIRPAVIAAAPLALASLCLSPLAAQDAQSQSAPDVETEGTTEAAPPTKGEARLAKLIEGRVAGEPVRCIRTLPSQRMTTIDRTAYVYGSGDTIYVQRTRNPRQIDDDDALVTQRFNASELCRLDQMTTVDRVLGFFTGAVFFEDFVPYTRVKPNEAGEG
ncbi:hypothetical protein GVM20_11160 [Porphyrobacter sp. SLTP]|uniref:hypothetical protein n=1 Tax=Porphyrobacter sp. SLTP TaxID=2683266 RepID=UPI0014125EB5|nr:hypothetical protein [Porphyrobacter sp. SLTP]NBB25686.1 hypothetical protein [Porphyrobacter sp. SLTP]